MAGCRVTGCDGHRSGQRGSLAGRAPEMLLSPGDTQTGSRSGIDTGEKGRVPACTEMRDKALGRPECLEAARMPVVWSVCVGSLCRLCVCVCVFLQRFSGASLKEHSQRSAFLSVDSNGCQLYVMQVKSSSREY